MTTLLKYEWMRRRRLLAGAAASIVCLEGIALLAIWRGGGWNVWAVALTLALTVGGALLPLLDAVTQLYADFKRKQGYMLFMTPRTGCQIAWAKALFALLELAAALALIAGCLWLSAAVTDRTHDGLISGFITGLRDQWVRDAGPGIPFGVILASFACVFLIESFFAIALAMLALTVSRVMLPGNSFKWFVALIMYFALALAVQLADAALLAAFGLAGDIRLLEAQTVDMGRYALKYAALGGALYAMWSVVCVTLSGRLINRGVDL